MFLLHLSSGPPIAFRDRIRSAGIESSKLLFRSNGGCDFRFFEDHAESTNAFPWWCHRGPDTWRISLDCRNIQAVTEIAELPRPGGPMAAENLPLFWREARETVGERANQRLLSGCAGYTERAPRSKRFVKPARASGFDTGWRLEAGGVLRPVPVIPPADRLNSHAYTTSAQWMMNNQGEAQVRRLPPQIRRRHRRIRLS